jgi:hypothetical protein
MTVDGELFPPLTLVRRTLEKEYGLLPTPCTVDSGSMFNRSNSPGASLRPTLGAMARFNMWPTPTASEDAAGKSGSKMQVMLGNHKDVRGEGGGVLNPTWVEWLMGWPLGWTDLKPLETVRFHEWLELHGSC